MAKKKDKLIYQEKNLNGSFEVYESYMKVVYPNSGLNKKEYIIDFSDIYTIEIATDYIPLVFKNLHITLNDETMYNFCISKKKVNEWNEIINHIDENNFEPVNVKIDTSNKHSKSNHEKQKSSSNKLIIIAVIIVIIILFNIPAKINKSNVCDIVQNNVRKMLREPSSAIFETCNVIEEKENVFSVNGVFNGKNAYGGISSNMYTGHITVADDGYHYSLDYVKVYN